MVIILYLGTGLLLFFFTDIYPDHQEDLQEAKTAEFCGQTSNQHT